LEELNHQKNEYENADFDVFDLFLINQILNGTAMFELNQQNQKLNSGIRIF